MIGYSNVLDKGVDTSTCVHKTGDETIAGVKTFTSDIVGNITGNAATATNATNATNAQNAANATNAGSADEADKLATARTITLAGDVTGNTSFDGSKNVTINTTQKSEGLNFSELVQALGTLTTNTTINAANGCVATLTVGADITLTPSVTKTGATTMTLLITDGDDYTITWANTITWEDGEAPEMSGLDMVTLITFNGGTTWYGTSAVNLA